MTILLQRISGLLASLVSGDAAFRRIITNSTWLFGAGGMRAILGLIQGIVVARALGVELYGILAIITSFTGVMGQVFSSRSWEMGIKFVTEFRAQKEENRALAILKVGYLIDVAAGILSFSIAWFLADWGARVFIQDAQYAHAIRVYAFSLLLNFNGGTIVVTRVFNRYDLLAKVGVLQSAFHLILVLIAVYILNVGLIGILTTYVVAGTFSLILGLWVFRHVVRSNFTKSPLRARMSSLRNCFPQILGFLFSTNLTDLFKIVQKNGATLALGHFSSPVEAGYFKLAQSFANRLTLIYDPIFHTAYPELASLWAKKQIKRITSLLFKLAMTFAPLGLFAAVLTLIAGKTVIGWTAGLSYLPATNALIVLVVSQAIAGSFIWLGPTLLAMGLTGWRTTAVAAGTLSMLLGLRAFVPDSGAVGAAAATILSHMAWASVGGVKLQKELRPGRRRG